MLMPVQRSRPEAREKTSMERMREAVDRIGGSLKGRIVVFVTDERDKKAESVVGEFMFEEVGASQRSRVISYNDLFSEPDQEADMLILRGSRIYEGAADRVTAALEGFRAGHPDSAVLVCYNVASYFQHVSPLLEAGLANMAAETLSMRVTDFHLMEMGARALAKLRGE